MNVKDILLKLCSVDGVSGSEGAVANTAKEFVEKFADCNTDSMGNVFATVGKGEKHILIDAHIDQIGMIVTAVDENGFLSVATCGGVDRRILLDSQVIIYGKNTAEGIVCCQPPHLTKNADYENAPDIEDVFIDTGLSGEKAKELISVGSKIALKSSPCELLNGKIASKSIDNRAGIAALIRCADILKEENLNCKVTYLFSCQEETGQRGAKISAFNCDPDEAIAVDVSFNYTPGCKKLQCGEMGKGPMIGVSPVLSDEVTESLKKLSDENDIPFQLEIMGEGTGTNADMIAVSRCGVKCGLLSIPISYMHTGAEVVLCDDIECTAQLLARFIKNGGAIQC